MLIRCKAALMIAINKQEELISRWGKQVKIYIFPSVSMGGT